MHIQVQRKVWRIFITIAIKLSCSKDAAMYITWFLELVARASGGNGNRTFLDAVVERKRLHSYTVANIATDF